MVGCNSTITLMEVNIKLEKASEEELVDITLYKQMV